MKRLAEEARPELEALNELVGGAERHVPNLFAKRALRLRLERALAAPAPRRTRRSAWLALGALLVAGSAAAASYAVWSNASPTRPPAVSVPAPVPRAPSAAPHVAALPVAPSTTAPPTPSAERRSERLRERPRAGEDPSQVAEAVRALRKQGDAARAQSLLERYLRDNPRGALAEDALALAIEAAAARKDARATDYARRYLARYPGGRFRSLAERTLAR